VPLATYHQLADLLLQRKRYPQALASYRYLYETQGARDRATLLHYGFCLEQTGDLDGAVRLYDEALAADAGFLEAHVDMAGVLWRVGEFERALRHAQAAVHLAPQHPYAVRVLGTALLNLNRLPEAEAALRQALQLQPGFVLGELDLAFTLLLGGRLEEGWRWYQRRWNDTDRLQRPPFFQAALEWQGPQAQPLAGRRIAVYAEQGLGDAIQFARYVPLLQQQGAQVVGVMPPALVPLLEHSFPGLQCLTPERRFEVDLHAALLDLPLHFGTTLDTIPSHTPYLQPPAEAIARWGERLAPWRGKFRIGIAWSGYQGQVNNRNRAFLLSELMPLVQSNGVQCFSLQKGDAGAWTDVRLPPEQLVDLTPEWRDFNDSAAMLQHLDLVITVDTAIAHLAGALGRPVWVMLPPNPDWRWLLQREDSPWYSGMRLFRRGFGEGRAPQVHRVMEALGSRLRGNDGV